jgi:lipid-A-disaccharide synthase
LKLLISALEPSANLHLREVLKDFDGEICGIFDKDLGTPIADSAEFSIMGFLDVLPKISFFKQKLNEMAELSKSCDKVLLIDAPSFNLRLAKKIKKINPNIEIIYYILPKVWAWKKGRIKEVNKYVDKKAYIFPFEKEYWRDGNYVGNPLLDEIKEFRDDKTYNTVSFLPGSRKSEIKKLMPVFRKLKQKIDKKALLVVHPKYKNKVAEIYGDVSGFDIVYDAKKALLKSDFAYICSGTATLEAAIIGTPFVLMYKARWIEYLIAKMLVKLKYVGLANIIFEKENLGEFHKEYLQKFDIKQLIKDMESANITLFKEKSMKLRKILKHGSAKKVKKLIFS